MPHKGVEAGSGDDVLQNSPTNQSPGVFRRKIGDIVVTAILDGMLVGSYDMLSGLPEAEMRREMEEAFRPGAPTSSISCFVVHTAGKVVLIDTGTGANPMFDGGRLPQGLNAAGISPDGIDTVILTHLHPDHTGGLSSPDGRPVFPNAELLMHAEEARFWLDGTAPEGMQPFFDSAKAAVAPYAERTRTFTDGELAPGIAAEPLPGHTPGHSGLHISSGSEQLLFWTDIVHLPVLQARHPEIGIAFDLDPEQAREQRRRLFDKVATDRLLVAGTHMDFPTFAHLERHGAGYAFVPERWLPTL